MPQPSSTCGLSAFCGLEASTRLDRQCFFVAVVESQRSTARRQWQVSSRTLLPHVQLMNSSSDQSATYSHILLSADDSSRRDRDSLAAPFPTALSPKGSEWKLPSVATARVGESPVKAGRCITIQREHDSRAAMHAGTQRSGCLIGNLEAHSDACTCNG